MAKSKKQVAKKSIVSENQLALAYGATALSVLLTAYYFAHLIQLVQDVKDSGIVGAPASIAGVVAAVAGVYAATVTKNRRIRYTVVAVLTTLLCGFLVWLLGVTGAATNATF